MKRKYLIFTYCFVFIVISLFSADVLASSKKLISEPISNASSRITKKYFWIKVSPWHSPITPERFKWYHTWVDFETTPAEQNKDISIYAICNGPILLKKIASWYWWVIVQKCIIDNMKVTVIYGHLNIKSINLKIKQIISAGQKIAILGKWFSSETDWERKHLHLWIHKWYSINIAGYVSNKKDLGNWVNPEKYL